MCGEVTAEVGPVPATSMHMRESDASRTSHTTQTTLSGSNFLPVGPIWMSVFISGQMETIRHSELGARLVPHNRGSRVAAATRS